MTGPRRLPDGGVVVPPAVAVELVALVIETLLSTRVVASAELVDLLDLLEEGGDEAVSDIGPAPVTSSRMDEVTAEEAGRMVGTSARQVRRLIGAGQVSGRRVGRRVWLVAVDSLNEHYRRTA